MEKTVVSIAEIKRVRVRENNNGVNCLVMDNFKPTKDGDKTVDYIPISIIIALLRSDLKSNILILSIAKALQKSGENISLNDCVETAIRIVLTHLKIKAEYNLHTPEEEYKPGCNYTTNWYQIDSDSIKFSYGQHKTAYQNCDAEYFIKDNKTVVEDF